MTIMITTRTVLPDPRSSHGDEVHRVVEGLDVEDVVIEHLAHLEAS